MMLAGTGKQWTSKSIKAFIYGTLTLCFQMSADFDGR
jgi:hypothetical protein